jgi:hypothetical protein
MMKDILETVVFAGHEGNQRHRFGIAKLFLPLSGLLTNDIF